MPAASGPMRAASAPDHRPFPPPAHAPTHPRHCFSFEGSESQLSEEGQTNRDTPPPRCCLFYKRCPNPKVASIPPGIETEPGAPCPCRWGPGVCGCPMSLQLGTWVSNGCPMSLQLGTSVSNGCPMSLQSGTWVSREARPSTNHSRTLNSTTPRVPHVPAVGDMGIARSATFHEPFTEAQSQPHPSPQSGKTENSTTPIPPASQPTPEPQDSGAYTVTSQSASYP